MSARRILKIERKHPREEIPETQEYKKGFGYVMGHPKHSSEKHKAENAVYVKTLEEAAFLVDSGLSLRMIRPGKRASLISPDSLRIVYSD